VVDGPEVLQVVRPADAAQQVELHLGVGLEPPADREEGGVLHHAVGVAGALDDRGDPFRELLLDLLVHLLEGEGH